MSLNRTVRYVFLRFFRIRRDSREIARGLAIGVFVGMTPFLGFHMVLAVSLAMFLKGNKFMALLGTWVGNPLTFSFIFFLDYRIGRWMLGGDPNAWRPLSLHPVEILHASWNILFPMSVGSLLLGLAVAVPAYFLSNPLVRGIQYWARQRKLHG